MILGGSGGKNDIFSVLKSSSFCVSVIHFATLLSATGNIILCSADKWQSHKFKMYIIFYCQLIKTKIREL